MWILYELSHFLVPVTNKLSMLLIICESLNVHYLITFTLGAKSWRTHTRPNDTQDNDTQNNNENIYTDYLQQLSSVVANA